MNDVERRAMMAKLHGRGIREAKLVNGKWERA